MTEISKKEVMKTNYINESREDERKICYNIASIIR
jgi:hypothetical protein